MLFSKLQFRIGIKSILSVNTFNFRSTTINSNILNYGPPSLSTSTSVRQNYKYTIQAFKESLPPHLKEFKVTENALDQLKFLKEKFPNKILRVSVETGGCHGFQYKFALELLENCTEDDLIFKNLNSKADKNIKTEAKEVETVTGIHTDNDCDCSIIFICDRISYEILKSARLDYSKELIGSTFQIVDNPVAASGCGCGVSFDLKIDQN